MFDGTVTKRIERARNIAIGKRLIQLFRRPLGGRSPVQPRKHAGEEGVARTRRIDGLDVDCRERVFLSTEAPFAAVLSERHADEFFGEARNVVLAEDRNFVLRKFDDVGKGNDLTIDF